MKHTIRLLLTAGLIAGTAVLARAEKQNGPCRGDIETFCKDIQPGQGRIIACLKAHEKELSPECKERRAQVKKAVKEIAATCQDDVERICGDVKPGQGRIRDCLKNHLSEVSAECKEKIATVHSLGNMKHK